MAGRERKRAPVPAGAVIWFLLVSYVCICRATYGTVNEHERVRMRTRIRAYRSCRCTAAAHVKLASLDVPAVAQNLAASWAAPWYCHCQRKQVVGQYESSSFETWFEACEQEQERMQGVDQGWGQGC